jgi:hypothetical protein
MPVHPVTYIVMDKEIIVLRFHMLENDVLQPPAVATCPEGLVLELYALLLNPLLHC